jgi:adenylate cyclase
VVVLKLLGGPSVSRSGTVVSGRAVQGRRLALIATLAAARGRPVTRDKIIALLWPESPTDRARRQLSDTLYILRTRLGDDVIQATGDDLALNDEAVSSDLADFERMLDAGQLEAAVEIFRGPLLDGFHLSDAAEFERWLDDERSRLSQAYADSLEEIARRTETTGDFAAGVGWWRKLAAHDPYSTRIALGLMRWLDAAGDRAGALKHARVHAELLQQEFDAEPDTDVVAFAEQLRLAPPVRVTQRAEKVRATMDEPTRVDIDRTSGPDVPVRRERSYSRVVIAAVIAIFTVGTVLGIAALRSHDGPKANAMAVLPFVNMSADSGGDYFSDGLTEQIITALSHIPELRVAARTSSFALRDTKLDIRAIGDTLNVDAVLEGSVRRDGNRLRVTAQLIDAKTGYHIWSGDYDREMRQVLEVQDEVANDIAKALELRMPQRAVLPGDHPPPNLEAYDLYLRALYLRDTFTQEALDQARQYLDRAVELDPDFALAYAHKATVLGPALYWRFVPLESGVAEAHAAVTRALALDPGLGDAYGALGMIKLFFDWDFPGAERTLLRAVELNPNDHHAWHQLANFYRATGRPPAAARARAHAVALDPLNVRFGMMLADDHAASGHIDEALAQFTRIMRLDPAHPMLVGYSPYAPNGPWVIYWKQGRHPEVVAEYLRMASLRGASAAELDDLRDAFQQNGMPAFWRSWLEFDLRHAGGSPQPVRVATFYALAGDTANAVEWLERAYEERNPALIYVFTDPNFAALRENPRFRRIFQQMKFPGSQ